MYLDKGFFMSFHHRVHGENFHKKDVVFHCISEENTSTPQSRPGDFKTCICDGQQD